MKLSQVGDKLNEVILEGFIAEAGYGRLYDMDYLNYKVDPRPLMLILGKYKHPRTRNLLVGGINLHYITPKQLERLRKALPKILQNKNLRERYRAGVRLAPDTFANAYRTYNSDHIRVITPSTLKYWNPKVDGKALANKKVKPSVDIGGLKKGKPIKAKPVITKKKWADKKREAAQANQEIDYDRLSTELQIDNSEELKDIDFEIEDPTDDDMQTPEFYNDGKEYKSEDEIDDLLDNHQYIKKCLFGNNLTNFENVSAIYNRSTGQILLDNKDPMIMLAKSGWGSDAISVEYGDDDIKNTVAEIVKTLRDDHERIV